MGTLKKHIATHTKQDLDDLLLKTQQQVSQEGKTIQPNVYKKILSLAKSLNDEKSYGKDLLMIAWHYLHKRQFNTSLLYISECLTLSKKINAQDWLPKLYNWSGYIHKAKGDFSNAIDYYELEIDINTKLNLEKDNIVAYQVLGNIYEYLENNRVAETYFLKAKSIAEKYPSYREVINNLPMLNASLICILTESNRNTEAQKLAFETLEFINKHNTVPKITTAFIYEALSLIYFENKQYDRSIEYVLKADKFPIKNYGELLFSVIRLKAYNYEVLGDYDNAILFYRKSIQLIEKVNGAYVPRLETLKKAVAFYEKNGHTKEANRVYLLMDKIEAELQTLHAKLKLRYRAAFSYESINNEIAGSKILTLQTINNGTVKLNMKTITACYTDNSTQKNVSTILIAEQQNEITTRKSLKSLYEIINHDNFVWIDRNAFINKANVEDWEQVAQMGKVTIAGKNFSVSRSKRKELFNNHIKTQHTT